MVNRAHDGTKLLWHCDRVKAHFEHGNRMAPIHIDMGISKFCQIRCVYCFGKYQTPQNVFIKKEPLLNTILEAGGSGVKSIALIGDGDPTCNPHLYEALDVAREKTPLDMAISTNGVTVDNDDKCHSILSSCEWMRFCLSAGTKDGYIKIHGRDYFDRVIENVKRMVEIKRKFKYECEVGLQSVFVPELMAGEMIAESKLAVDLGVDYFVIKQCSLPDAGETGMAQFDVNDYDSDKVKDELKACEAMSNGKTDILIKWITMKMKGKRPYNGCLSVPFISEISGNGDWFPCGYMFGGKQEFEQYRFGNLHDNSFHNILHGERYWDIIRKMRYEFDVHKDCKGACRLDHTNEFCYHYLNKPRGINFI